MKKFCGSLREKAKNIIDCDNTVNKKNLKLHQYGTECYNCRKKVIKLFAKNKNQRKVRDHCNYTGKYMGVAYCISNLELNVSSKIPVLFRNGSVIIIILS